MQPVSLIVNGEKVDSHAEPRTHLGDFLREDQRLTGTHLGCEHGICGACTVLIDGRSFKSCTVLAVQADGKSVTTIEGVGNGRELAAVQEAFKQHHGLQCGYCTPGMVLATVELLNQNANPDEEAIRHGLAGNVCRCTGYSGIVDSVKAAAAAGVGK